MNDKTSKTLEGWPTVTVVFRGTDAIETLAGISHRIWSHWMKYLFSKCKRKRNGSMIIPTHLVERWMKQMFLNFDRLTEKEKESDRDIIRKFYGL